MKAIATLFVSDLHASFIPVNLFLTQGSPRVGDADFYKWFESKKNTMVSYRLTHKKDPIPHVNKNLKIKYLKSIFSYLSNFRAFTILIRKFTIQTILIINYANQFSEKILIVA